MSRKLLEDIILYYRSNPYSFIEEMYYAKITIPQKMIIDILLGCDLFKYRSFLYNSSIGNSKKGG